VQRLINTVMNPALLAQIYIFFRQEIKELEDIGAFLSKEDYYAYRRNHVQEALGGQQVKSIGEKWLADFLFEHGIRYAYERIWYWDDENEGNYQPDFSITTDGKFPNIVIEHWGIDLNDRQQQVPEYWDKSWLEYRQQIDKKRDYWKRFNRKNPDQQVLFLETSITDLRAGREAFEDIVARMLTSAGVYLEKLPEDELQKRVVTSRIGRFSTMCLQYIQKAKKQRLTPKDMAEKISKASDLDIKTKSFLRIANNLYARYQKALAAENKTDFDDLMESAIGAVHQDKGNCQIRIDDDRYTAMNELRWIMIDEYQDFSRLFYGLIDAIRTYNRSVKLFCVGDDWQAINAFAGSDLHFFDQFQSLISGAETGDLRNNYRSARPIVENGNRFMHGKGQPSVPKRADLHGKVETCYTDKIWIEQRRLEEYAKERASDERFYTYITVNNEKRRTDTGLRIGRMLKKCYEILTSTDYDKDTTFAVLSRTERLGTGYPNLRAFHRKLKETLLPDQKKKFADFDSRVHCGTVHSFKGLEADVVIILAVNERNFPKIHPDNELFSIFGVTPTQVLAEEERLFYVAITRAKKDLYLFTETGRESGFLNRLWSLVS
jgi:DNA helicase-4